MTKENYSLLSCSLSHIILARSFAVSSSNHLPEKYPRIFFFVKASRLQLMTLKCDVELKVSWKEIDETIRTYENGGCISMLGRITQNKEFQTPGKP